MRRSARARADATKNPPSLRTFKLELLTSPALPASRAADLNAAQTIDVETITECRYGKASGDNAARHHDVSFPQALPLRSEMAGKPRERLERMAERVGAPATSDLHAVLIGHAHDFVEVGRRRLDESTEDDARVPRIVGDERFAIQHRIVGVTIVDQFDGRTYRVDRVTHLRPGVRRFLGLEIPSEASAYLEFEAQVVIVGDGDFRAAAHHTSGENGACDRMIDAAHGLHPLRRQAEFVADDQVGADDFSKIDFLNLVGRRKIGKTFERVEILTVAMLRRNQFGGGSNAGGHMLAFNSNGRFARWREVKQSLILSQASSNHRTSVRDAEREPARHPRARAGQQPGHREE